MFWFLIIIAILVFIIFTGGIMLSSPSSDDNVYNRNDRNGGTDVYPY